MSSLSFEVEENLLREVKSILDSVGLDVELAFSIFMNKIVKEKGLPFSLKQPTEEKQAAGTFDTKASKRTNNVITTEMIEEVWNSFKQYKKGYNDIKDLSYQVSEKTDMNQGSAMIYLNILIKLSDGVINKRSMKPTDFEFFLNKFKKEYGRAQFDKAIKSIEISIPYWKNNIPTFAESMEVLLAEIK
ncbi:MAG: type II toxin-antitoxin system RelB/DinJ family antitoxin [Tenericutes bacterium]|nr:type II toxin-antitoxin system RelB/DinJ family antitoxin [Mycoplasmatota bacterium]